MTGYVGPLHCRLPTSFRTALKYGVVFFLFQWIRWPLCLPQFAWEKKLCCCCGNPVASLSPNTKNFQSVGLTLYLLTQDGSGKVSRQQNAWPPWDCWWKGNCITLWTNSVALEDSSDMVLAQRWFILNNRLAHTSGRHTGRFLTLQAKLVTLLGAVDLQRFGNCS